MLFCHISYAEKAPAQNILIF